MPEVIKPKVRSLANGNKFVAKEMSGKKDKLLPLHHADVESIIYISEGECILKLGDEDIPLKQGEAYIVPPKVKHQFLGITDFKGIHFMPKDIKIEFFK